MNALDYLKLSAVDNMFSSQEERDAEKIGKLAEVEIDQLVDFKNHPFPVVEDDEMNELRKSIEEKYPRPVEIGTDLSDLQEAVGGYIEVTYPFDENVGVIMNEEGKLEIVAGHRRKYCCKTLGFKTMPVLIKNLDRDQATLIMGESNLNRRENIPPSVKVHTYMIMLDAYYHQGKRNDLTLAATEDDKLTSKERLAKKTNQSVRSIERILKLNKLLPQLLNLVDQKRIGIQPGGKLAELPPELQAEVFNYYSKENVTPSHSQAKAMVDLYIENQNGKFENGTLDASKIEEILKEKKGNQKEDKIAIITESFRDKFFPGCQGQSQIEQAIINLFKELDQYRSGNKTTEHIRS